MRNFILADNQELTRFALENLLQQDETAVVYRAFDKAGLVALLKEHESAIVILDYTLFDFTDEDQLLIVAERFALSQWVLLSDELTSRFLRRALEAIISQQQEEDEQPSVLTSTETEIVKAIAQGKTTKEIASERFSSIHTITTHRKNIFRKLGVNTAHEVVKYALRAGLIDSSEFYI